MQKENENHVSYFYYFLLPDIALPEVKELFNTNNN